MIDGSHKLKDQWLLPSGVLREPISACRRADILVVTRKTERPDMKQTTVDRLPFFMRRRAY